MTLRDVIDRPLDPLRPGGRWARLLKGLEGGPLETNDLLDAVGPHKGSRWRERRKTVVALHALASLGFVDATHWGWARTRAGTEALAALPPDPEADTTPDANPETEPCDA